MGFPRMHVRTVISFSLASLSHPLPRPDQSGPDQTELLPPHPFLTTKRSLPYYALLTYML